MKEFVVSVMLILSLLMTGSAQDFFFLRVDGTKGLSHNHVKAMVQDSHGFMWIGTRNRLNRYDGISMKQFDCYDPGTKRRNNNISALLEDFDNRLWVGTDKGVFLFDPVKEVFTSFDRKSGTGVAIKDWIADIKCDADSNIWVVSPNEGVFKYERSTGKLHYYTVVDELKPNIDYPQCITIEKNGKVWIGTNGSGVFLYDKNNNSFTQYLGDAEGNRYLSEKNIYTIAHDNDFIYIGIHESKLVKLDKRRNILTDMNVDEINYKIIRDIRVLDNKIWVATESGLFVIDEMNNTLLHAVQDPLASYSLSDIITEKIYEDKEGGIWVGTRFGGANYLPARYNKFEKYVPTKDNLDIASKRIGDIREDKEGMIWVGTEDAGLMTFNPETRQFKKVNDLSYKKTRSLMIRNNEVWVGYFKNGLDILSPGNKVSHYSPADLRLDEETVNSLCEDRYGRVWLANSFGVFVAEKNERKFKRMDIFGFSYTFDIIEDSDGYIWVATIGKGVFQYDPRNRELVHFVSNGENSLSSNSVTSITEDHLGQMWFSTDRGGICVYNKMNKTFKSFSIKDGLPDDITFKILEDKNNQLWFGTNKGLVRFDPETKKVRVYTRNDGLLSDQYNYKSGLVSSSNKLYFGCMEGLIVVDPDALIENKTIPPVYITRFLIANEEVKPGVENSPLEKSIIHTDKIKLRHNQSSVAFDFVAINYMNAPSNMYAYKMENIDDAWVRTQNNHSASYAKLPPGKYVFRVKASNNDGMWDDKGRSLEIEILPPWWTSNLAYAIYFLLVCAILYFSIHYSLSKYRKRNREKQQIFEIEKEKELYQNKINFFTYIAHEIRTPVTLINGPLESIMGMEIPDLKIRQNLEIIENNTKHLLSLINQLLDFRKVDSDRFLMTFRSTDVAELLNDTIKSFKGQLTLGKKELTVNQLTPVRQLVADKEALKKILDNLLSNAIKYSDKKIEVQLTSDSLYFTVRVINDGERIPEEYRDKIFEPFFQIKTPHRETSGSGIGLALASSLAELHHGYLHYEIRDGMNHFVLRIPIDLEAKMEDEAAIPISMEPGNQQGTKKQTQTILIVEDNQDMLSFLSDLLRNDFIIEKATNGIEAQNILKSGDPDIVISDIMMPQMDGFELCTYVKSNTEFHHIIFILLTARNDLDSKIKGLQLGADAYIEKPFSPGYLKTMIASLQAGRQRELELFLKKPFLPLMNTSPSKGDEDFLNNVIAQVTEHIADPDFNVEGLASSLLISRSSLHRRIKAATGKSPVDFIRFVRMQKAAQLILEGKFRIYEISNLVGINTTSYFIKLFQSQFGMTPKDFEEQHKNQSLS